MQTRIMKGCQQTACAIVLLFGCTSVVADPQNGFGVYAGVISAKEGSLSSHGLSLGADAQFTFSEQWSLVPYLMVSRESSGTAWSVSDDLAGLQVRRWFGEVFLGVQGLVHARLLLSNGTVERSAYGPAGGLVGGVELASGWGFELQTDWLENTNTIGTRRNAVRAHLTYRWR